MNIDSKNNNTHFTRLKGIKYKAMFSPKSFREDAKVVKTFRESEAFKQLFQKHDGFAVFESDFSIAHEYNPYSKLTLYYRKTREKLNNPIKNLLSKIKHFLNPPKYEKLTFSKYEGTKGEKSRASNRLAETLERQTIKSIGFDAGIEKSHNKI